MKDVTPTSAPGGQAGTVGRRPEDLEPWSAHARAWSRLGPPLRPTPDDLVRLSTAWRESLPEGCSSDPVRVLTLGVTPELAAHRWAPRVELMALDASADMIREVWPGDAVGRRAFRGDWLSMPFEDGSFDLVLSDCGLTPLVGPGLLEALGDEMRRVLRPEGRVVMRHFASGDWVGALPALRGLAQKGVVAGFHEFKLRLLMAVDAELDEDGVPLGLVWERFQQEFPDRRELAMQLGVDATEVDTIDAYRGKTVRYAFPPVDQLASRFAGFEVTLGPPGQYGFAEACPVFSLAPVR